MPLAYIEKEKLFQNEWEKRKKEAIKNINKKIPDEYLLKIFETIILDNDTKVNEENPQQSQEFEIFEEKPLQDNENKQESKNWTQFKTEYPNIAQIIKNSKNTGIKVLIALIKFFEINNDPLGITEYILILNEERKKEKMNIKEIEEKIKNIWKERGFLEICVSLFYKVLVQINSVFKFYHKMSNCCISILNRQCSFFCYIFNC
ncbi:hypothetical protein [Spiroplasma endosymbiont of Amphimallon solstitiale]|uniref:hypothetical protein n=1 Tax=Spiroplasma endosymbiont of Amphimallon solstitiale TaxID=3066288 RepID=UPI00313D4AF8